MVLPSPSKIFLLATLLLAGCSQQEDAQQDMDNNGNTQAQAEAAAQTPGGETSGEAGTTGGTAEPYASFNTTATIRDIMNTLIDPHADELWNAVSYVSTEDGVEQQRPETEEDWAALRRNAVAIIEGANSLMIPGREVAPPGATTPYPDYEFQPGEVAERLEQNRQAFVAFAQGLQQATLQALNAIEARDAERLIEVGGAIDEACEACHSQYWYRPEPLNADDQNPGAANTGDGSNNDSGQ